MRKKVAIALGVIAFGGMFIFGGIQAIGIFVVVAIIAAGIASLLTDPPPMTLVKKKCSRQPHLDCPLTVQMTERGGISSEGAYAVL